MRTLKIIAGLFVIGAAFVAVNVPARAHGPEEASDAVVLLDTAVVHHKYISVLEVVRQDRLTGDARTILSGIYLGRSPAQGESKTITLGQILEEINRRGLAFDRLRFVGDKVVVTRGATLDVAETKIIDLIRQSMKGDVSLHILDLNFDGAKIVEATEFLNLLAPAAGQHGTFTVKIRTRNPDGQEGVARVLVTAADLIFVVTAAKDMPQGLLISAEDVQLRQIESSEGHPYLTRQDVVIGSRTTKPVRKDTLLTSDLVKLKTLIHRNQVVRARSSTIQIDARALKEGTLEEIIDLEYVTTKNHLKGRVVSGTEVDIIE